MNTVRKIAATGASIVAIGTGVGFWVEIEGNNDARDRVITVDACLKQYPGEQKVTKAIEECLEDGVPGGEPLGNKVDVGDPIEFVESARQHEDDRSNFSLGRVAVHGVAAPFVVGGMVLFALSGPSR